MNTETAPIQGANVVVMHCNRCHKNFDYGLAMNAHTRILSKDNSICSFESVEKRSWCTSCQVCRKRFFY